MPETSKKILIIEDERLILKALTEGLKRRKYNIINAENGESGLEMIQSENPDLVLLDLILPKMNGQEVLNKLKDMGLLEKIPVIVLTNLSDGATFKKCIDMGARDFIIKSNFSFDEIDKSIRSLIFI